MAATAVERLLRRLQCSRGILCGCNVRAHCLHGVYHLVAVVRHSVRVGRRSVVATQRLQVCCRVRRVRQPPLRQRCLPPCRRRLCCVRGVAGCVTRGCGAQAQGGALFGARVRRCSLKGVQRLLQLAALRTGVGSELGVLRRTLQASSGCVGGFLGCRVVRVG